MAPTRRRRTGGAALDTGAMERIDAITLEPLCADGKYVELMSPDRTLKLYYNTSTLIRIAQDAGGFMQPPHFREAMSEEMQKQVEELEKKTFHFEKGGRSLGESLGSIHHRHVYFEQIIDEFYHLSSADVYVCPVCYEHYLRTRYLPRHPRVAFVNNGETPVVDPLTLLQWSSPPEEEEEADDDVVESHATTMDTISRFVFRYATNWKKHMDVVHHLPQMSTQDYRLRDVLCSYYSAYNQRQTEKAKAAAAADDQKKLPLTQHRYWRVDAGYNRVRYNRLVEALEAIPDRDRNAVETAFPDETMNFQLNPVDEGDDDFVVEDDDVSSSSCDSGYHPRYQPPESLRATSSSSSSSTSSASSTPPAEVRPTGSRKRGRLSYSHSSSTSSSSASTPVTSKGGEDNTPSSSRRIQLRHGRLAPLDGFTARLSAEDQHFLASQTSKTYRPNSLYDPKMHQYFAKQAAPKNHEEEEVDWECIGEHTSPPVEPSTSASDDEDEEEEEESETATAVPFISRGGLLLDDDE